MPDLSIYNENLLLEALRNGSANAFEQIFKKYGHSLYLIAKSKVQSHAEAEEIIQSIFTSLWERREEVHITNLAHYLHTAVRNQAINLIRSKLSHKKFWDYYSSFIPRYQAATGDIVEFDDLNHAVEEAVNHLPEKSKKVFKLSRMEGRSNAEIAHLLHLSEKTIEYHLTKSLRELRLHLKDFT